jgi:hypothetical protein
LFLLHPVTVTDLKGVKEQLKKFSSSSPAKGGGSGDNASSKASTKKPKNSRPKPITTKATSVNPRLPASDPVEPLTIDLTALAIED